MKYLLRITKYFNPNLEEYFNNCLVLYDSWSYIMFYLSHSYILSDPLQLFRWRHEPLTNQQQVCRSSSIYLTSFTRIMSRLRIVNHRPEYLASDSKLFKYAYVVWLKCWCSFFAIFHSSFELFVRTAGDMKIFNNRFAMVFSNWYTVMACRREQNFLGFTKNCDYTRFLSIYIDTFFIASLIKDHNPQHLFLRRLSCHL